jgi:hypothetical protein
MKAERQANSLRSPLGSTVILACVALIVSVALPDPVLAQGQDSTTSTQAPHTNAHPVPVLSTDSVTSIPSGTPIPGSAFPQDMRPRSSTSFGLSGPVPIPQVQLACNDIQDDTARGRCQSRTGPPAFPKGAAD